MCVYVLHYIVFEYLYSAPKQPWANTVRFWFAQLQERRQIFISDKDVVRLDDKKETR